MCERVDSIDKALMKRGLGGGDTKDRNKVASISLSLHLLVSQSS